jgi:23S rRNA (guanosine2251-2'-O)-methyltransferase
MFFFGRHPCLAALSNPARDILAIFIDDEKWISLIPSHHHVKIRHISKKEMDHKVGPQNNHQGIVVELNALRSLSYFDAMNQENQCVVVLDQITDPHNVGAIIRSCAVFGAKAIIMLGRHAPKESGIIAKAASGGLEKVQLVVSKNLAQAIDDLKQQNFWTFGLLEKGDKPLGAHTLIQRVALIMGAEGSGMREKTKKLCDFYAYIPSSSAFSTLNVSNATAIALYEVHKQNNLL